MSSTFSRAGGDSPTRLQSRGARLLTALDTLYAKARPEVPSGGFKDRVFLRLDQVLRSHPKALLRPDDSFDAEAMDRLILEVEDLPIGVDVWFIYAACAYAIAAIHAMEIGDETRSWEMLADANFHLGWAFSLSEGEEITDVIFSERFKAARSKAATDGRHRKTNEMKAWAYEYVRAQGEWPSQARAVAALEEELKKEFGDDCLKDFEGTVTKWLKEMPGREQLFETLRANRTKS